MATCLQIITYAMRQARIIGPGKEPKASEAAEGMIALQSLYDQWVHNAMFGELEEIYLEENETALEGKRYYIPVGLGLTAASRIYVDEAGNTRLPRDLAIYETLSSDGTRGVKLFDRDDWVDLLELELTDEAPLSSRNAYGLAACLATYGGFTTVFGDAELSPRVERLAKQFLASVMGKVGTTQDQTGSVFY